jgi:DNA-binding NtrC family response regulator
VDFLVVDDTLYLAQVVRRVALDTGVKVRFAGSLHELPLVLETNGVPDLLLVNVSGEVTGWDVAARMQRSAYRGRILAFVDRLSDPNVRHLMQIPRTECVARPASPTLLEEILRNVMARGSAEPAGPSRTPAPLGFHGIIGRSPKMMDVFARIEKVAAGDANVCICGESGTGKELIARAIHYASPRRDRPLIALDCTTIPEGLMESHLLGHVKGAFTGAVEHREGVFSLADKGTLFIDELTELALPLQAKLLRVIQNREFVRVGGSKPIKTDVRLITASNKDPKREVENGRFREDLYYRVAVFMINVPPLRDRREDIPVLIDHFLHRFSVRYGKRIDGVEPRALESLVAQPWPGNVRQLENFLEQAVVLADGTMLTERDLFSNEPAAVATAPPASPVFEPGLPMREVERRHILNTLKSVGNNRTEAAKRLEISVRCLQYKLKEYEKKAREFAT